MRLISALFLSLVLTSCVARIEPMVGKPASTPKGKVFWPVWEPSSFGQVSQFAPKEITLKEGRVMSFGPRSDRSEEFMVISKRNDTQYKGIFPMRLCFLPTSILAGKSPYLKDTNKLYTRSKSFWMFSAMNYRTTQFELRPATVTPAKGMLVYHTSIMLLSKVEEKFVKRMQNRGWNVVVALPPDSLYRSRLPALASSSGDLFDAARILADDMDRHYSEQAYSTRTALAYLRKTRPDWLTGRKVLIGTSAGTFGLPAEVLMNPDWDSIVIVSGGTNLLSTFESGAAKVFPNAMKWVDNVREEEAPEIERILNEDEYHMIYRNAAKMTRLHAGALAPQLKGQRILMIQGRIDRIIPRDQTREFHEALGRPERWSYPLGHHLIAVQLVLEADRLDRWLMGS